MFWEHTLSYAQKQNVHKALLLDGKEFSRGRKLRHSPFLTNIPEKKTNSYEHSTATTTLDSQATAKTAETSQDERLETKAVKESNLPKAKNETPENDDGFGSLLLSIFQTLVYR